MARKSDPVEALAKVLWEAQDKWRAQFYCEQGNMKWAREARFIRDKFRALARAAIAHLKPKRGAKRA